jgi:hypothetical protein
VAREALVGLETRQSHGLGQFCATLEERPGLSILDFAGGNQATISFITGYGHRLYSDDFVHQLDQAFENGQGDFFENQSNPLLVSKFMGAVLEFKDQSFDGALVWDSLQSLLAMFHTEERIESIATYSYRIQDHHTVQMTAREQRKPGQIFTNRSLEKLFQDFESVKFFLTRDRLREVIVRR